MIPEYISVELIASLIVVYLKIGEILVMIISSWNNFEKKMNIKGVKLIAI